jgi:hypothetical protein
MAEDVMKKLMVFILFVVACMPIYSTGNKEILFSFGAEHDYTSEVGSDFFTDGSGSAGIYFNYAKFNEGRDIGTFIHTYYLVPYGSSIEDPGTGEFYPSSWADFRLSIGMAMGPIARWELRPGNSLFFSLGPCFKQHSFITSVELSNDIFLSYIFGGVATTGITFKIASGWYIDTGVKAEYSFIDYTQSGFDNYTFSYDYNHLSVRAYVGMGISKKLVYSNN